ncbi:MFS transporter [Sphingobium sp. Cam5-1]|uniref:MFS transporter n=1 Tax=Sphingobium sp. Cam5-1 TaxID=2789327 RepID=UPI0018AD1DA6|nr:MFS transporter [Sphingobium sp. Cam5-1]QPI72479.1 MFS transporter [Sphingobium sp. Cam5-1]
MAQETATGSFGMRSASAPFLGWRMVAIAFLAQNCAVGLCYGSYGPLIETLQAEFHTSRTLAASGLSALSLVMGLCSPMVGALTHGFSLRLLMMIGAIGNAAGFFLLSMAGSIEMVLAIFGLIIGPSVCLLGVVPTSTLISNWFLLARGRALGIINTSFFIVLAPIATATILQTLGIRAVFLSIALIFVTLLPVLAFVVTRPEDVGQTQWGQDQAAIAPAPRPEKAASSREIMTSKPFWVLGIIIGLLTAAGIMMMTHLVPMAQSMGIGLESASLLLSIYGMAGVLGALLFGWLADRVGGRLAIAIQAFAWIVPWLLLLAVDGDFVTMLLLSIWIGLCSGSVVVLLGVTMGQWMGQANFGRAMGLVYFIKIPFMFVAGPLGGFIFDMTGSYRWAIILHATTFLGVGLAALLYRPRQNYG